MSTHTQYKIHHLDISQTDSIRAVWERLAAGPDMTYHQSHGWYSMLSAHTPANKHIDTGYWIVERDGEPVMIAPLWIVKSRFGVVNAPGVYFIGRNSFTDYLNFIYDDFRVDAFMALVHHIARQYGRNLKWHFELLREDSSTYRQIAAMSLGGGCSILHDTVTTCAALSLPSTKEEYASSLSKNTRQNLRTAANRARKDGIEFSVRIDDRETDRALCKRLREIWAERRKKRRKGDASWKGRLYMWLHHHLHDRWLIEYPEYLPFVDDANSHLLTISHNGELAAFFCYGHDDTHSSILVMTAATNEKYVRYSPGMLSMAAFIDHCIERQGIDSIDFTRGNEPYKYSLGAKTHLIHSLTVSFADS